MSVEMSAVGQESGISCGERDACLLNDVKEKTQVEQQADLTIDIEKATSNFKEDHKLEGSRPR